MTNHPHTARIHRRIDLLLIALTIAILVLIVCTSANAASNFWDDATSDRYLEEDSWWAERAAVFFPRYHFTLQASRLALVSEERDGAIGAPYAPDEILANRTWSNTGTDFNTGASWGGTAPGAGDLAVFSVAAVTQPNLSASLTIQGLNFSTTTSSGYNLTSTNTGIQLTLTNAGANIAINAANTSGTNTINAPIILGAAAASTQTFTQAAGGTLTLNGVISSTNSITLSLSSTGTFNLNGANTYTGTTSFVNAGSIIGIGNAAAFGTSTINFSINNSFRANVDLTGANALTNAITLGNNPIFLDSGSFGLEFDGNVNMGAASRIIDSRISGGLTFDGNFTNGAGSGLTFITSNGSVVTLNGTSTYTGNTTISGTGMLSVSNIGNSGASGNIGAGVGINLGSGTAAGFLLYTGTGETTNKIINLNGTTGGATIDQSGTGLLKFTGTNTATGSGVKTLTLQGSTAGTGEISGAIPNSGSATSLLKLGTGTWTLSGTTANTYTGATTVGDGRLELAKTAAVNAFGGTLAIGDGIGVANSAELRITTAFQQMSTSTAVSIFNDGLFALNGNNQTIGTLAMTGGSVTTGAGILTLGNNVTGNAATTSATISGKLSLGGADRTFTIANGAAVDDMSIDAIISSVGAFGLVKAGLGTLVLSGANTFTGGLTVSAGTLSIGTINNASTNGVLGNSATAVALNSGTLQYTGATASSTRLFNMGAGGGTFQVDNGGTTLTLSGVIAGGANALTKTGAGTLAFGGSTANTYSGATTVKDGRLELAKTAVVNAFGGSLAIGDGVGAANSAEVRITTAFQQMSTSTAVSIFNDGLFALNGNNQTIGALTMTGGSVTTDAGTLTLGGNVTGNAAATSATISGLLSLGAANRTFTIADGAAAVDMSIDAIISSVGAFGLIKAGAGTLVLSGANTYTGATTVSAGTLRLGIDGALPSGTALTVGTSGATAGQVIFDLAGFNQTIASLQLFGGNTAVTNSGIITLGGGTLTVNGNITYESGALNRYPSTISGAGALDLGGATRTFNIFDNNNSTTGGDLQISSIIQNGGITKTGAGILVLSGANTYSGATTIDAGTLSINSIANVSGGSSALGAPTTAGNGTIKIGSGTTGATLQYTGSGHTSDRVIDLAGTTGGATLDASGTGALVLTSDFTATGAGDKTLTLTGSSTAANTIQGKIVDNSGANTTSVTKSGTGTWVLSGASTYTGATAISAGVLRAANSNALGTTAGGVTVSAGAALELDGTAGALTIGAEALTLNGTGISSAGALRNIAGSNSYAGVITLATDSRINSDAGATLTLSGGFNESGGSLKTLTFGGAGNIAVSSAIAGDAGDLAVAKDGAGTLTLSAANTYDGTTTVSGGTMVLNGANGAIASSTGITVGGGATLQLDNTSNNNGNRIGAVTVTMNGGTFDFTHAANATAYSETAGTLAINSGASTISTDVSASGGSSILTFGALSRTAGATVNFGGGTGNPSATNDDNNIRFTSAPTVTNGIIGTWATVGGSDWATYNTASATDSLEALATYTDVTRLSSGTKVIADVPANNVRIVEGTGSAGNITLGAAITRINTLNQSTSGGTSAATIDPAGQTLRVFGILVGTGAGGLTIGTGTNNGTLTTNASGGELVLLNFSNNALTANSVIANHTTASGLTVSGTGRTVLTAANTYTGSTFVSGGTLLVNNTTGSGTGTGAVTVNGSGTILGGTGTISGGVTVNVNSILQGGNGTTGTTLTLAGALTLNDNSIIQLALGAAGTHSTLARSGANTWTFDANQAFTFIDLGATTGTYDNIITGIANPPSEGSWTITNDNWAGTFTYDGANIDLTLTAVPEPSTWLAGALTLGVLGWSQRKRFARLIKRVA